MKDTEELVRTRLTLDLSGRMAAAISGYAEKTGKTKAEVLRSAIDLLLAADEAAEENFKVGAWKEEGNMRSEREFVGLGRR
jgi:predicted DNA-binding protein